MWKVLDADLHLRGWLSEKRQGVQDTLRAALVWLIPIVVVALLTLVNYLYRRLHPQKAEAVSIKKKKHRVEPNPFSYSTSAFDTQGALFAAGKARANETVRLSQDTSGWVHCVLVLLFFSTLQQAVGNIRTLGTLLDSAFHSAFFDVGGLFVAWVVGGIWFLASTYAYQKAVVTGVLPRRLELPAQAVLECVTFFGHIFYLRTRTEWALFQRLALGMETAVFLFKQHSYINTNRSLREEKEKGGPASGTWIKRFGARTPAGSASAGKGLLDALRRFRSRSRSNSGAGVDYAVAASAAAGGIEGGEPLQRLQQPLKGDASGAAEVQLPQLRLRRKVEAEAEPQPAEGPLDSVDGGMSAPAAVGHRGDRIAGSHGTGAGAGAGDNAATHGWPTLQAAIQWLKETLLEDTYRVQTALRHRSEMHLFGRSSRRPRRGEGASSSQERRAPGAVSADDGVHMDGDAAAALRQASGASASSASSRWSSTPSQGPVPVLRVAQPGQLAAQRGGAPPYTAHEREDSEPSESPESPVEPVGASNLGGRIPMNVAAAAEPADGDEEGIATPDSVVSHASTASTSSVASGNEGDQLSADTLSTTEDEAAIETVLREPSLARGLGKRAQREMEEALQDTPAAEADSAADAIRTDGGAPPPGDGGLLDTAVPSTSVPRATAVVGAASALGEVGVGAPFDQRAVLDTTVRPVSIRGSSVASSSAGVEGGLGAGAAGHEYSSNGNAIFAEFKGQPCQTKEVAYPDNITLRDFLYFAAAPTLVYEPCYPRNLVIRPAYVAEKAFLAVGLILAGAYMVTNQFKPVLQHINEMDPFDAILQLTVPSTLTWCANLLAAPRWVK